MKASFFYLRGVSPFCLCSLHLTSVPPACLPLYPPAAVPAPTLWVLQGQKEYFFGDAVTLVCTTPPSITGKLTYQIFGEAGWAVSGFSSTSNYTFEFVLSRMQHRGPHFCSYSLKQGRKQLISPTSEKLVIKIGGELCDFFIFLSAFSLLSENYSDAQTWVSAIAPQCDNSPGNQDWWALWFNPAHPQNQ